MDNDQLQNEWDDQRAAIAAAEVVETTNAYGMLKVTNPVTGEVAYYDEDGDPTLECCWEAFPHTCGDCWGGSDRDPYVTGDFPTVPSYDYYDGGRLRHYPEGLA